MNTGASWPPPWLWWRWRLRLARARHHENHLRWKADLWPAEVSAEAVEAATMARQLLEWTQP